MNQYCGNEFNCDVINEKSLSVKNFELVVVNNVIYNYCISRVEERF